MISKTNSNTNIAESNDKIESLHSFNQVKQKFATMANQIKNQIEEKKKGFKIEIFEHMNNFKNDVKKAEIKFLGQNAFPELHSFLTSESNLQSSP